MQARLIGSKLFFVALAGASLLVGCLLPTSNSDTANAVALRGHGDSVKVRHDSDRIGEDRDSGKAGDRDTSEAREHRGMWEEGRDSAKVGDRDSGEVEHHRIGDSTKTCSKGTEHEGDSTRVGSGDKDDSTKTSGTAPADSGKS